MRLTVSTIARLVLPAGIDDKIYFDDDLPGFGLRLRRSGAGSWWVQYALAGRTRKLRLGSLAELDIGKARSTAKDVLARVRLGADPAGEKNHSRMRAGETFGALIKPFMIRQQTRLRPRSLQETDRHLVKLCRPLHPLPVAALDRRAIATRLSAAASANGPAAANRMRASLSAFFAWAAREGYVEANPVAMTNKAVENGPRDRVLSDEELIRIWQALRDDQYSVIVKLLILTGLRRGEIGGLRWSEIDLPGNLIVLPAERTKNGRTHLVPMSAPGRTLIEAQPRHADRDQVFASQGWHAAKTELDARIAELHGAPLAPWVLHDLRRAFSTALHDKLGVAPHVVEVLLGHVGHQGGVAGVYNRSSYLAECARALDRWSEHVMALVTGETAAGKVLHFPS